jgi:hypothetical protein
MVAQAVPHLPEPCVSQVLSTQVRLKLTRFAYPLVESCGLAYVTDVKPKSDHTETLHIT